MFSENRMPFLIERIRNTLIGFSALLFLVVNVNGAANSAEINIRIQEDFGNLDPAFWQSRTDLLFINAIFPKLIEFKSGSKWEWELSAAESIEQTSDLEIKFVLKPGLMWTNGYGEVTAEDVKYSYERMINPKLNAPNKGDWAALDKVEVTGRYSGIIHLKEPFAPMWTSTLPFSGGSIVSKAATEKAGGKFTTNPDATAGPYKIASWAPKEKTVLAPHDGWNGEKAAFNKITLLPIAEPKAAELAFEANEIDFTEVESSSVASLNSAMPDGGKFETRPSADYLWLGMNIANPALSDARIRKAISKAVDVQAILQGAYFGVPAQSNGLIAPGLLGHRDITPPARDIDGARALIAEAGIANLSLELELQNRAELVTAAQIIQANLAEIGVNVQINQLDSGSFWNVASEKQENLQLALKSYVSPPDPSWSTQWFVTEQKAVWNWEWLENAEFDRLHADALKEADSEKRAKMYHRMQDIMDDTGAFVWILHPTTALLYRDTISPGLYPNGRMKLADFKPSG